MFVYSQDGKSFYKFLNEYDEYDEIFMIMIQASMN